MSNVRFVLFSALTFFVLILAFAPPVAGNSLEPPRQSLEIGHIITPTMSAINSCVTELKTDQQYAKYRKPDRLEDYVCTASVLNGVQPRLLMNLLAAESGFRTDVVSKSGAVGIAQIIPRFWGTSAVRLKDFRIAVHKGAEILALYKVECGGDVECAVHSYNVGITNYRNGMRNESYARKVLAGIGV